MADSDALPAPVAANLARGAVIPALPLALDADRRLDERRQRALCRYYLAAGAGGIAVGVHTTQFAIREPCHALFRPVLALAAEELKRHGSSTGQSPIAIAGICGDTKQAAREAELARALGYHAGLLSLAALKDADDKVLLGHCRRIAEIIPLVGFYLQPAVGGRVLSYAFWRRFAEIERVVAVKVAAFNRYQTLDVVRAVAESGRDDIALYTGNDDHILLDLITPYHFQVNGRAVERRFVGGLLGQWAVWTRRAVELLDECRAVMEQDSAIPLAWFRKAAALTDANSAIFDAANNFAGCIAGIHEVLRRQGLLEGIWCLDARETPSPGQEREIDRVCRAYPELADDDFVVSHKDEWLRS